MKKRTKTIGFPEFSGTAVLGERGQVVIPKEARKALSLKTGESFLVMVHNNAIFFIPKKKMATFIKKLTAKLNI